jgi:hypothetical protein
LVAKTGFTLQGVEADSFTVAGATSANNEANSGVVKAVFPQTYVETTVNITNIEDVTVPETGKEPGINFIETDQYTGTVSWSPTALPAFTSATQYTAFITLTVKDGYTLDGVTANLFKVKGASSVKNNADSGYITAVFPKTATTIGITAIAGVTAPIVGGIPVTSITPTTQYDGIVSWKNAAGEEPADVFTEYNVYIATITLTPKAGYTFKGVGVNSFSVAGAVSKNNANTGIITATFPQIPYAPGGAGPSGGKIFYSSTGGFTVLGYGDPGDPGYFAPYTAHYIEAAPSGSGALAWASPLYTSTPINGTGTAIGTGRKNTALILAIDADAPAAKACRDLTAGGKTDWFLPSKDEVDMLFENRGYVNNLGNANYYCSSGASSKIFQQLGDDDGWRSDSKDKAHYVRAIRAF